ncbi:bifunctional DNA primase/polymerase [Streptomyces sp. RKAG337]|uniref:bifunctional DNA primase/polymerase n=1 Tax=Streptomyces sp. RKAG337 TaxID=2893404 RepID=UPI002033882E|nr:bifunctional DNA primase/polymerase [Streptomyces sp. RKAG337]MCM2428802.1 bifunctional DNA primase/polymerase [Streptomyces sp. RKAG337]
MTQDPARALLHAALEAAARGWHVIPLRPGDKPPALHGEQRCPRTGDCTTGHRKWEQRATTDPARLRTAWATGAFNVGIATGPSGLVVVDLDMPKPKEPKGTPSGVTTFQALCERAGHPVPATYRTRTARGGQHLYFTAPDGVRLGSTHNERLKIDTRAWGGQVVAAGSVTPNGSYAVMDALPVALFPEWIQEALYSRPRAARPVMVSLPERAGRYAQTVLEREVAAVAAAHEGGREAELFRAARAVGRFVAWGDLDRHVVEEAFQVAAESTGLPASQCRSTLRSALDWSIRTAQPRRTA